MESNEDARAAVDTLHQAFSKAVTDKDLASLGRFYAEDAIVLAPGRPVVSGRDQIVLFWQRLRRLQALSFTPSEVKMLGDSVIRETGALALTLSGPDGKSQKVAARYVSMWVKGADGWQLTSAVWNRSGGGRPQGAGRGGRPGQGARPGQGQGGRPGQGGGGRPGQGGAGRGGGRGPGRGGQGGGGQGGRGQGGGGNRGGQQGGGAQRRPGEGARPASPERAAIQDAPVVPQID